MNFEVILRAGLSTGTILIFAAIGEIPHWQPAIHGWDCWPGSWQAAF